MSPAPRTRSRASVRRVQKPNGSAPRAGTRQGAMFGPQGVRIVGGDVLVGLLALPLAAAARTVITDDPGASGPGIGLRELQSSALWITALLSSLLWPLALRALDTGYPSPRPHLRQVALATLTWLLAASGSIYLLDKDLESRALVVIASLIALLGSSAVRAANARPVGQQRHPATPLPQLERRVELALVRGEPIAISFERLGRALPRPATVLDNGVLWIYPSVLSPAEQLMKRLFDIVFSALLIVLTAPVALAAACAILLLDGGPVIYSDERAGAFGRKIRIHKFRTMRVGAARQRAALWKQSETRGPAFKLRHDPRVTPLGRILRKYSIDELPQLFDVLAGTMSLIGPRPAGRDELARYENRHRVRLTVRPGITGLWQVRRRFDDDFEQRMSDDLEYIARWTPALDLLIAAQTVKVVLSGRGV